MPTHSSVANLAFEYDKCTCNVVASRIKPDVLPSFEEVEVPTTGELRQR